MPELVHKLIVHADGILSFGEKSFRCALGRGGCHLQKSEGDGVTPIGTWRLKRLYYRADRLDAPKCILPIQALTKLDGWCDAPGHADYNRFVTLPHAASHEELWHKDNVYDVIVTLDHNDDPVVPGAGSAIFFHIARESYAPTEGCIALTLPDMLEVLSLIGPDSVMEIKES